VAIWRARASSRLLRELERRKASLVEVEDGFIRSAGLGADCVPPLSIVVDRLGAHFDPERPSELEQLLQQGEFPPPLVNRARRLRHAIVASGLSKYAAGGKPVHRRHPSRTHILVPGQVEDDRAVVSGGAGLSSNLELLRRVRVSCPDDYIIYKPHPDVEAGHRSGAVADERCLEFADEIVRSEPISALLDLADEVHVNTSLAGFEALLRRKKVTTHGVPFYAGWGLTHDLGPVPTRRTAKRTLDELVAATLLLYPRYVDPLTLLPCPAEVVVDRLAEGRTEGMGGLVVRLRRMQGRVRRSLAAVRSLVAA
jgi:capsular polysaccharide export protein